MGMKRTHAIDDLKSKIKDLLFGFHQAAEYRCCLVVRVSCMTRVNSSIASFCLYDITRPERLYVIISLVVKFLCRNTGVATIVHADYSGSDASLLYNLLITN
jgi:hypothetical protein